MWALPGAWEEAQGGMLGGSAPCLPLLHCPDSPLPLSPPLCTGAQREAGAHQLSINSVHTNPKP